MANTVDSISHANFRSNFQTNRTESDIEGKQMRPLPLQIQDRGTHNYRQQRDLQDLQSNLQEDPPLNLQVDLPQDLQAYLQMDLQANLQVSMDLQPDLWVQTGLGATQHSPLVFFHAETSTEREKSMGGTCEWRRPMGSRRLAQGPKHVIGEQSTGTYTDLQGSTGTYTDLQGSIGTYMELQGSTGTYMDLQGSTPDTDLQDSPNHRIYTQTTSSHVQWQSAYTISVTHHSVPALHSASV